LWEVIKQNIVNRFIALPKLFTSAFSGLSKGAMGAALAVKGIFDKEARKESKKYFEEAAQESRNFANNLGQVLTGIEDPLDKLAEGSAKMRAELEEKVRLAGELEEAMNDVLVRERELGVERARQKRDLQEVRDAARDLNTPPQERLELIKQIRESEAQYFDDVVANEQERLRIMQAQAELSETDEATKQAIADQEAKILDLERERFERSMSLTRDQTAVQRQIFDQQIRNERRLLDAEVGRREFAIREQQKALTEQGKLVEIAVMRQTAFRETKEQETLDRIRAAHTELRRQNIQDEEQFALAEERIRREMAEQEMDLNESVMDARRQRREAERSFEFEQERLQAERLLNAELHQLEMRNDQVGQIRAQQISLEEQQEREKEQRLYDLREGFIQQGIEREKAADMARLRLEEEYMQERMNLEMQLSKAVRQANQQLVDAIVSLNSAGMKAMFGDNKAAAAAATITETLAGATRAFMANPGPVGAINAAAAMAVGAANLRQILRTQVGDTSVGTTGRASGAQARESFGLVDVGGIGQQFASVLAAQASPADMDRDLPPIVIEGEFDPAFLAIKVSQGRNEISSQATGF